jgi:hypothetical protein
MAGMDNGQKKSVLAWLEWIVVRKVSFSMAGMDCCPASA